MYDEYEGMMLLVVLDSGGKDSVEELMAVRCNAVCFVSGPACAKKGGSFDVCSGEP